jgi:hypothetical protein
MCAESSPVSTSHPIVRTIIPGAVAHLFDVALHDVQTPQARLLHIVEDFALASATKSIDFFGANS